MKLNQEAYAAEVNSILEKLKQPNVSIEQKYVLYCKLQKLSQLGQRVARKGGWE